MAKVMTATEGTAELKRMGCTDEQCNKVAALPNVNFAALIALLGKLATTGISLADILAALGL